jgi:hypothetical protein
MAKRPISVVELSTFIRSAEAAGLDDEDRGALIDFLARNPLAGDVIKETGGVRKLRWAREGSGKSGGYRTVYFHCDEYAPIYAILVYGKGRQADLTPQQRQSAARFVEALKKAIRAGRSGKVGT